MITICRILLAVLICATPAQVAWGQLKKQFGSEPPQNMTQDELDELGDPVFELFLEDMSDQTELESIEEAIQPDADKRRLFIVSERIINDKREGSRRAVITFEGTNSGVSLKPNAMLSAIFTSDDFVDGFAEAWGWDENSGRYNYYRLDEQGGGLSWKFRGSSMNKELFGKKDTCFACHLNGAPIMKELLTPWNHWHSRSSKIPYFSRLQPAAKRWPVADKARFDRLSDAALLDSMIRSSIKNFNRTRIKAAIDNESLKDAKPVLRHLFVTTEFNMISARQKSNMHPLNGDPNTQPSLDVQIPGSFFLNSAIIAGGGAGGFTGLGVSDATTFQSKKVTPQECRALVNQFDLSIDGKPGDADFAWLIPEPSDIDNDIIERLMSTSTVPAHYVAAVMAIDLRKPVLSTQRQSLLDFVPEKFELSKPANAGNRFDQVWFKEHDLTKKTIAKLEAFDISGNPAAIDFLKTLKMSDGKTPLETLEARVKDYATEVTTKLSGSERDAELKRLFKIAVQRRKDVIGHPLLGSLDETGGKLLFPASGN